jgi:oxygen-independent coproporphyrinogen-3 oxidase
MSGIYIHIPFCRKRCHYCDFYTTTQIKRKPELVNALLRELILRKPFFSNEQINTIYFGGGTPSLLSVEDINRILDTIFSHYVVVHNPEITLEANPDDLSEKHLVRLAQTRINRLSIGIQSFHNHQLQLMNRRHSAQEAIDSVKFAQETGIKNISIDLIYGLPESNATLWNQSLEQAGKLNVQHISAYHLSYEKGTVFDVKTRQGKLFPCSEDESISQFQALIDWAGKEKFIHYEISNFGKEGCFSQHNTNYWKQEKYLGIGPSAHSYNINSRTWNASNLSVYIDSIDKGNLPLEEEILSETDKYNEFLITSLRTRWGINLQVLEQIFGTEKKKKLIGQAQPYIQNQKLYNKNNSLILSDAGVFVSDMVLAELMILPDE